MRADLPLDGKEGEQARWLAGSLHRRFRAKVNATYYRELARSRLPGVSLKGEDSALAEEIQQRRKFTRRVSLSFGLLGIVSLGVFLATGGSDSFSGILALCVAILFLSFFFEIPAYSAFVYPASLLKALEPKLKLSPVERDYLNAMIRLSQREPLDTEPNRALRQQLHRAIDDYYGIKPGRNRPLSPTAATAVTLVHERIQEVLDQLAEPLTHQPISELPEVSRFITDVSTLEAQNAALEQAMTDEFGSDDGLHSRS